MERPISQECKSHDSELEEAKTTLTFGIGTPRVLYHCWGTLQHTAGSQTITQIGDVIKLTLAMKCEGMCGRGGVVYTFKTPT